MIPKLEFVEHVRNCTIRVRFSDGIEADLDLRDKLWGEVFEPLKDPTAFRGFELNEELNTVTWKSGADFAPEFLYEKALAHQPPKTDGS